MFFLNELFFFVSSFIAVFLFVKIFDKKIMQSVEEGSEESVDSLKDNNQNVGKKEEADSVSFSKENKSFITDLKYSFIITPLFFSVIAALCGAFVFGSLEGYSNDLPQIIIKLARMCLAYCCIAYFSLTDFKYCVIPNKALLIFLSIRLVLIPLEYIFIKDSFFNIMGDCFIGSAAFFVVFMLVSLLSHGGFGMGDAKMFSIMALISGTYCAINTLLYGLICCAIFSVAAMLFGKKKIKDKIPFAPFVFFGFVITVLLGSY